MFPEALKVPTVPPFEVLGATIDLHKDISLFAWSQWEGPGCVQAGDSTVTEMVVTCNGHTHRHTICQIILLHIIFVPQDICLKTLPTVHVHMNRQTSSNHMCT